MDHPYHSMEIAVDDGAIELKVHCDATAGAPCHMVPECVGPDSTTLCYPDEGGIVHGEQCKYRTDEEGEGGTPDHEIPKVDSGECWVITWFEEMDQTLNSTEVGTSITVPIEVNWMGDYMGWSFAALPNVKDVLTKVRDTWQWKDWTILTPSRSVLQSAQRVTNWLTAQIEKVH